MPLANKGGLSNTPGEICWTLQLVIVAMQVLNSQILLLTSKGVSLQGPESGCAVSSDNRLALIAIRLARPKTRGIKIKASHLASLVDR